jgi:hypothetical protein
MMNDGQDVMYCEYKNRGFESYHEEQERIFKWMQPMRRVPLSDVAEWKTGALRISDNSFYWMQAKEISEQYFPPILWDSARPNVPRKKTYEGNLTPSGTIYVNHPGEHTTIWLSPVLFDFKNRCHVWANHKSVFNDFVSPSLEALLSELRERGDRERLFWARLDL